MQLNFFIISSSLCAGQHTSAFKIIQDCGIQIWLLNESIAAKTDAFDNDLHGRVVNHSSNDGDFSSLGKSKKFLALVLVTVFEHRHIWVTNTFLFQLSPLANVCVCVCVCVCVRACVHACVRVCVREREREEGRERECMQGRIYTESKMVLDFCLISAKTY